MKIVGLVLSLLSLVLGAAGVWLEKAEIAASVKRRARYLIGTAVAIALFSMGVLIIGFVDARADERAAESSRRTVGEIQKFVSDMAPVVKSLPELIEKNLAHKLPSTIGVKVASDPELFKISAGHEKGTVSDWRHYRDWLLSNKAQRPNELTYLRVQLNGNLSGAAQRHWSTYRVRLLLAYIWANGSPTDAAIEARLESHDPSYANSVATFPDPAFLQNGIPKALVDFVVFVDESDAIVGFAHANELANDLLAIRLSDGVIGFEKTLNEPLPTPLVHNLAHLPSFHGAMNDAKDSAEIVQRMIDQGVHEVMINAAASGGVFYVALSKAIKML